jgi:hypothetical protein
MTRFKDGFWMLVVRKGKAFIPTMARTDAGFYIGMEPVEVVDATEREEVENAIMRAITRGNPPVPTPSPGDYPKSPPQERAKVKSPSAFERSAQRWKLSRHGGTWEIVPYKRVKPAGAVEDRDLMEVPPDSEPLPTVVRRLVERALGWVDL